jgi:hypothetical protein
MKFPFVGFDAWMIVKIAMVSLYGSLAVRIVAQLKKISCGFHARASKTALKHAWKRQEIPGSGVVENSLISMSLLYY